MKISASFFYWFSGFFASAALDMWAHHHDVWLAVLHLFMSGAAIVYGRMEPRR